MVRKLVFMHLVFFIPTALLYARDATFYLKNMSSDTIHIKLIQNQESITGWWWVPRDGSDIAFNVNTTIPTTLEIKYCPTTEYCKENLPHTLLVSFNPGKIIHIEFDGTTILPQQENRITKKNTVDYSTSNNVTTSDITVTPGTTKNGYANIDLNKKYDKSRELQPIPTPPAQHQLASPADNTRNTSLRWKKRETIIQPQ